MLTLVASILFFTPDAGAKTRCVHNETVGINEATCAVYQCGLELCTSVCAACNDTLVSRDGSAPCPQECIFAPNAIAVTVWTILVVQPIGMVIKLMFAWLQRPHHEAIKTAHKDLLKPTIDEDVHGPVTVEDVVVEDIENDDAGLESYVDERHEGDTKNNIHDDTTQKSRYTIQRRNAENAMGPNLITVALLTVCVILIASKLRAQPMSIPHDPLY